MPKASKQTASTVQDMGVMEGRYEELGGYTVGFETFREDADATPMFKGLPDDRCQSPHWGYVARGRVTFRFAEGDEVYEAGDAYYAPPGHIPVIEAGTEIVEFSPTGEYEGAGISMFLLQSLPHCRPAAYDRWLGERGLEPFDAQDRIIRAGQPAATPAPLPAGRDIAVERVSPETADEWAEFMQRVYRLETGR